MVLALPDVAVCTTPAYTVALLQARLKPTYLLVDTHKVP